MESIYCIICNSNKASHYKKIKDTCNRSEAFTLVKCKCDLVFLNPRPDKEEISRYYDESYLPHNEKKTLFIKFYNFIQKITFFWKWRILKKNSLNLTAVLDIGGGAGTFCDYLENKNIKSINYDPYFNKRDVAPVSLDNYDAITLWHSLEHVHNIKELFSYIDSKLKKDGFLYIAIPNHDAYERSYFGDSWIAYDLPRHLYHFNQETIAKLLHIYGFTIIKTYSMIQDTFFNILLSKDMNLLKKIYVLLKSIIVISFNKKKSSSLLYVCKREY